MTADLDLITVTPWHGSGQRRLYVSDQRQSLGFLDEGTGTVVLTDARHRPVVEQALRTAGYPSVDETTHSTARRAPAAASDDASPAVASDPEQAWADPDRVWADPEQVWADLAAGRAPRTTSVPHHRRDPSTTLTALLLGDPSPDTRPGERQVAAEIASLVDTDPLWHVLEVDGTQIDHLLIGPGGVFALATQVHPGATVQIACRSTTVDGVRQPWVRTGLHARELAERALSQACHQAVTVTTLLVVVGADGLETTLPPPVGVIALDHQHLRRWLRAQPETLTPGTIAMLVDTARQSTAWYLR